MSERIILRVKHDIHVFKRTQKSSNKIFELFKI